MPKLSDPMIIIGKKIKNRIVMPPMVCFSFQGDHGGMYGEQYVDHYTRRARGGAGLIIMQSTPVVGAAEHLGVWSDGQRKPLQAIAGNCHSYGAVVMIQLSCGNVDINELAEEQIHKMQADCVAATASAKQAGFDGVEYHFAHGFTLCKFLDPDFNKRTDGYGGALQNRVRIITEILPQIHELAGEDFIVAVRMGGNIPDVAGAVEVARTLEKAGVDLLHISFGMTMPANAVPTGFNGSVIAYNGSEIRKHVHVPVIGVGEIADAGQAKFLIENDYLDFVAVGRGMLADENWANKVLADQPVNQCRHCDDNVRGCCWFVDHTQCPAREIGQEEK